MWVHSVLLCSSSYGLKHLKEGKHQVLPRTTSSSFFIFFSFFPFFPFSSFFLIYIYIYHLSCSLLVLHILWRMSGDSVISCKSKFQTVYLSVSHTLCYLGHPNKVLLNLWTPSTKYLNVWNLKASLYYHVQVGIFTTKKHD